MSVFASKGRIAVSTLAGAAMGYFILHPYTTVVYGLYDQGENMVDLFDFEAMADAALSAFRMGHLQMGLPFALIGAAGGLFLGLWLGELKRKKDSELRTCALDTTRTLMVTLSHYLLNAVTIIAGFAWRIQKENPDGETLKHAVVIRKEAGHIEAIVKSLQSVQEVASESYTKDSETMIIDLTSEIKKRMDEQAGHDMVNLRPSGGGEKR